MSKSNVIKLLDRIGSEPKLAQSLQANGGDLKATGRTAGLEFTDADIQAVFNGVGSKTGACLAKLRSDTALWKELQALRTVDMKKIGDLVARSGISFSQGELIGAVGMVMAQRRQHGNESKTASGELSDDELEQVAGGGDPLYDAAKALADAAAEIARGSPKRGA